MAEHLLKLSGILGVLRGDFYSACNLTDISVQTAVNTPDRYAERLPAHLLQSEKHPSAPTAKFAMQCNFPSLLRGLLGEKKGKRKGREGKEGKKAKMEGG